MKKTLIAAQSVALLLLTLSFSVSASEQQLPAAGTEPNKKDVAAESKGPEISLRIPLMSARFRDVPVAAVDNDVITLENLVDALASAHEGKKAEEEKKASSIDMTEMLNRIITVKLVVQEAREMGMDELQEVKEAVKANGKLMAKSLLVADITKNVKADEAEVERLRKQLVREWKIKSVLFEKEEDAKKMEEEMKSGKSFDALAKKAMDDKIAKSMSEGGFVKSRDLLPEIVSSVSKMEIGAVSPVMKVGSGKNVGFTIMKLEEIRYPDDPAAAEKARNAVLTAAKTEVINNFKKEAYKKDMKIDNKLLERLDFEAKKPGFEAMLKDKRTVVTVKGEKPVTVADLANAMKAKFFHGIERAISEKEVNKKKAEILDELLEGKVFEKEAAKRGIEKSEKYKKRMAEYEESLLFGLFVQKVMIPDVKVEEAEIKAYYDSHAGDYTTPEMMKLNALVFGTQEEADTALERLKKGADFNWMKSNAEGQVDSNTPGILTFSGTTVVTKSMNEGMQAALTGAKPEEYRLYKGGEGQFYVVYVQDVIPSSLQPYEEAKREIAKKVFDAKLKELMDDWGGKLRDAADVKIYVASPSPSGEMSGKH